MHGDGEVAAAPWPTGSGTVSDVPDLRSTAERTIVDLTDTAPFVSIGHYRYLAAQDPLPLQTHSHLIVLAFAMRGRFEFEVSERTLGLDAGEAIIIPPGNAYSTGRYAQTRGELIWLVLDDRPTSGPLAGVPSPALEMVEELLSQEVRTLRSPALSVELLGRVLAHKSGSGGGSPRWRQALCTAALAELMRTLEETGSASDLVHPDLRRAVAWATANLESALTAGDLLAASGMSSTRFYELFAATFGTSPKDYILRMKIDRASELLRTSALSVTEVSHRLGFSSSQHFATAFKRYLGASPTTYRSRG